MPERHPCPGGCGASIVRRHLACRSCWYLLPEPLRRAVTHPGARSRLVGVSEALSWYRNYREEHGL